MKGLRNALVVWAAFTAWTWIWGPLGWVTGGIGFLAGWAIGHRTGRHDAEREHYRAWHAWGRPETRTFPPLHSIEGDRP